MTDLRFALRSLRLTPAFTAVVVLTMTAAIAANTAMFSVYERLVLHPVTFPDPDALVAVWFNNPQRNVQSPSMSMPRYRALQRAQQSFASLGISAFDSLTLTGAEESALQLTGLRIDPSFLPTLGVLPARGRNFSAAEDVVNGPAVCILSHELWTSRFGARPDILGRTIHLNGTAWEVVGVMPPNLSPPFRQVQVFAPRVFEAGGLTPQQIEVGATFAQPIARLRPGVTMAQAAEELRAFSEKYRVENPGRIDSQNVSEPRGFVASLVSGVAPTMYTLLAAVACVLLIACANVASLFLARQVKRQSETAVRLSLGATRWQIARQFVAETLVVSAAAGALGTLAAIWALGALEAVIAAQLPPNTTLSLNWRTLLFTAGVTIASTMLTGWLPSLQASRASLAAALKEGARGSSVRSGRLRQALVVAEVALSVVLLVGAGLLLTSFVRLQRAEPGFDGRGVASAFVGLTADRYAAPDAQRTFFDQVIAALRAEPGVSDAAVGFGLPLTGTARTPYGVSGRSLPPPAERPLVNLNMVSDAFFGVLGIPVADGRAFGPDDRPNSPRVGVINQTLARKLFEGRSALGESLLVGRDGTPPVQIVGVIRDVRSAGVNQPVPDELYLSAVQAPRSGLNVIAKTTADPAALQRVIARAVASVDAAQAISFFATMETTLAQSLGTQQLMAMLTAIFGGLALLLALTGLYSVMAYYVSHRTPEIGIRMALGASRRNVIALVMRAGLWLVGLGLVIGVAAAAASGQLIAQLLFGVDALHLPTYAIVSVAFASVAAIACLGPSLRASRIDPLVAVRNE